MVLLGGKERTKREWSDLAASAGFKVVAFASVSPAAPNVMVTTLAKA